MPVKPEQVRYISNVFGHVYKWVVGFFFSFFSFLHIYLMHWSDPCRHLCCLDIQYVVDTGQLFFFLLFLYVHKMRLFIPAAFYTTESLAFTHILHTSTDSILNQPVVIKYISDGTTSL